MVSLKDNPEILTLNEPFFHVMRTTNFRLEIRYEYKVLSEAPHFRISCFSIFYIATYDQSYTHFPPCSIWCKVYIIGANVVVHVQYMAIK